MAGSKALFVLISSVAQAGFLLAQNDFVVSLLAFASKVFGLQV